MQITNNYQPNFKSGRIGKKALLALSDRLPSGQFDVFVNKFNKKHEGSAYKILLDTATKPKKRLDACITYDENNFRYLTEGVFSSFFCHPIKFMKQINKQIAEDLTSIALKGHID